VDAFPKKVDVDIITTKSDFDRPEGFWDEVLNPEVSFNNEAKGGKLT
jgi:hypothetical protein